MSTGQRIIIALSIAIALGASYLNWSENAPKDAFKPVETKQRFYSAPERIPNCINEIGCVVNTRIPEWLQKHQENQRGTNNSTQNEATEQASLAAIRSAIYGVFAGIVLYCLLAAANLGIRSLIQSTKKQAI